MSTAEVLVLDGRSLELEDLAGVAAGRPLTVAESALEHVAEVHWRAREATAGTRVYGRTTGVGAARDRPPDTSQDLGPLLLRAHAGGWGELLPERVVRAALAVRSNQLLSGGSGASPELVTALAELACVPAADLPVVHRRGSLGTGDLTALAEVGLALLGERRRAGGERRRRLRISGEDALPLMSSSAFVLAETALHVLALERLVRAATTVSALSWLALQGDPSPVSAIAAAASPHPGVAESAAGVRELLSGQDLRPRHVQDFFGLRTWPQVHGPLLHALDVLSGTTRRSINTASENPLFTPAADGAVVTHHGGFHTAYLVLALDTTLLALARAAHAVQSRVSHLLTDPDNGLPRFLADSGSTGALVAEYVAASALSVVRGSASAPSSVQTISLSAGVEDDATFAGEAVVRMGAAVAAYRRMLAAELFCAVRALRLADRVPTGRLGEAYLAVQALPADLGQRDLSGDLELAEELLGDLA